MFFVHVQDLANVTLANCVVDVIALLRGVVGARLYLSSSHTIQIVFFQKIFVQWYY